MYFIFQKCNLIKIFRLKKLPTCTLAGFDITIHSTSPQAGTKFNKNDNANMLPTIWQNRFIIIRPFIVAENVELNGSTRSQPTPTKEKNDPST
jgi:hypothetical protein